jgi:hypothetical protein
MDIRTTTEDPVQLHDDLPFISKQDISPGETHKPAYTIEGPDNYVIGIESNTPLGPELRQSNGDRIDGSTQITLQKADPQGNPLGNAIIFEHNMDAFDYEKMRSDPRFFRHTQKSLMLDEKEYLYIFLNLPSGANDFKADQSRLTLGDNVTQTGKPVYIREKDSLSKTQKQVVNQANSK